MTGVLETEHIRRARHTQRKMMHRRVRALAASKSRDARGHQNQERGGGQILSHSPWKDGPLPAP